MQILNDKSYHTISEDIARPIEGRASRAWWIAFGITLLATLWGVWAIWVTLCHNFLQERETSRL